MRVAVLAVPGLHILYRQRRAVVHLYQRCGQQSRQQLCQDSSPSPGAYPAPICRAVARAYTITIVSSGRKPLFKKIISSLQVHHERLALGRQFRHLFRLRLILRFLLQRSFLLMGQEVVTVIRALSRRCNVTGKSNVGI